MLGVGFADASSVIVGNMIGANRVGFAWHYAQIISAMTLVSAFALPYFLFYYLEMIADQFIHEPYLRAMLIELLPLIFICFIFDSMQI